MSKLDTTVARMTPSPHEHLSRSKGGFALRISERRVILMLFDLLLINGSLAIYTSLPLARRRELELSLGNYVTWMLTLSLIWLIIAHLFDVYDLKRAASIFSSLWVTAGAVLVTCGIYYLVPLVTPGIPTRRSHLIFFPLIAMASTAAWRTIYATVFTQPAFSRRALVIGAGKSARALLAMLHREEPERRSALGTDYAYNVLGFVDDDPAKQNTVIDGVAVLGTCYELDRLVTELEPNELVLAITDLHKVEAHVLRSVLAAREQGVHITTGLDLYEQVSGRVPVSYVGHQLHIVLPFKQSGSHRFYLLLRRTLDFVIALVGSMFLALLIPFVWLANRLADPGDLFYRQERIGAHGVPFKVIKFRSMIMNAERHTGAVWAEENDPRITRIGRFLRKTRLDEVPQFWNVLRGDMSFIGPRPERPVFVEQLARDIPFYGIRHAVKPGITGWAQVRFRYGASVGDALAKLEYDLYYIKHQSLYLDFQIVVKTIQVILGFRGR